MQSSAQDVDIVVQGYPGKTVCHGGLGWSTIALIRAGTRAALVDVGGFGIRKPLIQRLAARKLAPADVTDVLLTHSHHDHAVNWTLFNRSRIVIGARELEWSVKEPWGETPVPELYVRELERWPTVHRAAHGEEVFPRVTAHVAPGHTPGHLVFVLHGAERDVIFTGDAAKNRAELLSRRADATYDAAVSTASIGMIWELWRKRPGSILVAGHDVPMVQHDGRIDYVGKREAAIQAWFGADLEQTTLIELAVA